MIDTLSHNYVLQCRSTDTGDRYLAGVRRALWTKICYG
jgi:hypothetical protein